MKVELKDAESYFDYNFEYNEAIEDLVEKILGTETEEPIGYQISTQRNLFNKRYDSINRHNKRIINIESKPFLKKLNRIELKPNELGPVEIKLLEKLFTGSFSSILLTGALGSGKTALLKKIDKYIQDNINHKYCDLKKQNCIINEYFSIYLDFNEKVFGSDLREIKEKFYLKVNENLLSHIMLSLEHKTIIDYFYFDLLNKNEHDILTHFSSFKLHLKKTNPTIGTSDNKREKALFFLDWVDKHHLQNKLVYFSYFIKYLGRKFPLVSKGCYIFIFDNIDSIKDEYQGALLNEIWRLIDRTNARSIISLRLTTFQRIEVSRGSYSYGVFQNAGYNPIEILTKRLQYFLDYKSTDWFSEVYENLELAYRIHFDKRVNNLIEVLDNKKGNRLRSALLAMSGLSIRRCLYLSERLLKNSSIKYTIHDNNQNEYINALLVDNNEDELIREDDELVTNIFANRNSENSLLKIRILQILNINFNLKKNINIFTLIETLSCFYDWDTIEIFYAIDKLMNYKKRLIYINGVSSYSSSKELYNSKEDIVVITRTGIYYLNYLLENLQFAQTCFNSLDWLLSSEIPILKNENVGTNIFNEFLSDIKLIRPSLYKRLKNNSNLIDSLMIKSEFSIEEYLQPTIDSKNIIERISMVRKGLAILLNIDVNQTLNYLSKNKSKDCNLQLKESGLIMSLIISKFGFSVFKIFHSLRYSLNYQEELKNWESLVLVTDFWNKQLYGSNHKGISRLSAVYSNGLKDLSIKI